ncbi:MAG: coenzyme F420-0:L-glutamate ligase [Clostridia bacterium]
MDTIGTIVRGVRAPIFKQGDNLVELVANSVIAASEQNNVKMQDKDVVAVTEAVLARTQGNYATCDQIAKDVRAKTGGGVVGLLFPIFSRNRFSMLLSGISKGVDKLIIQLSYPADEVGNPLFDISLLDEKGINPYANSFTEEEFRKIFPTTVHPFTGVDYINYYKKLAGDNCDCQIILSNDTTEILKYADTIICADIHSRERSRKLLKKKGATTVLTLADLMNKPVDGSGYHEQYGLYGSNLATDNSVKLFPRDSQIFVDALQKRLSDYSGKKIECMIYGDGAFKDPVGGIWELADPVVSPAYTSGLIGQPNELKLKYIADNDLKDLKGEDAIVAMKKMIKNKAADLTNQAVSLGTTPRKLTDLIGSLCDLTSGSGDKGTPIIWIQNYFKNFSDND